MTHTKYCSASFCTPEHVTREERGTPNVGTKESVDVVSKLVTNTMKVMMEMPAYTKYLIRTKSCEYHAARVRDRISDKAQEVSYIFDVHKCKTFWTTLGSCFSKFTVAEKCFLVQYAL